MESLDDKIYSQITNLSEEGNKLASEGEFEEAKSKFSEALRLVPEPHTNWEAATWLYASIGDMHFFLKNFEETLCEFINAVQCPGGLGNPFIHLRLGQSFFELNNHAKAADELTRAYMGAGIDIFMEDDPKYLEFLETKIEL